MNNQQLTLLITKALAYTENGGKPNVSHLSAGKSGEMKSIFQFEPSTWKLYAKQELGDANAPLTNENEAMVVNKKVSDWVDHLTSEGVSQDEIPLKIASMWNAGENHPDAYKEDWKGTNSSGVKYDTPTYAARVGSYVKQFEKESPPSTPETASSGKASTIAQTPQENTQILNTLTQKLAGMGMPQNNGAPSQSVQQSSTPSGGLLSQIQSQMTTKGA